MMCTCSSDGKVKIWDIKKAEQIAVFLSPDMYPSLISAPGYNQVVFSIISPDNQFVYFGNRQAFIYKADIQGLKKPERVYEDNHMMTDGILSHDKKYLIFSSGYSIKYLIFKTDKIDKEIGTCENYVNNISLNPIDNNILVSWCEDGTLNFWNVNKKLNLSSIKAGNDTSYTKIAFSHDGLYVISGNSNNDARVWDAKTKNLLAELKGHSAVVRDAKFSLDNNFIVTSSYDGNLKIWKKNDNEDLGKSVVEVSTISKKDSLLKQEIFYEKNNIPILVRDRLVDKQEDINVTSENIEILVWDNLQEDGDIVSLNINGKWVLENYEITKTKKSIKYKIEKNTNNYIVLYAHNLGKRPPNTASVSINDGNGEKTLILKSDLKSSGAINLILVPKG